VSPLVPHSQQSSILLTAVIIIIDVRSTVIKPSAPFADSVHPHYITVQLFSIGVEFLWGKIITPQLCPACDIFGTSNY
jgi:hypothetical protein